MRTVADNRFFLGFLWIFFAVNLSAQDSSGDISHITGISDEINAPLRIAGDQNGGIYVTDAFSNSVVHYNASGEVLTTISTLSRPISVAVDIEGSLFVGDGESGHIYKFDESGNKTLFFADTKYPSSLEFGPDQILYVADSKLQVVYAIDLSGNLIQTIGSGILEYPTGLAYDSNNQRILVGEHGGSGTGFKPLVKVYMFEPDGSLYRSFGSHGSGDGQFYRIQGISLGKCDNIYVTDPFQARISVFSAEGEYITKFGDFGVEPGQLNIPMDIVFDSGDQMLVTSMNNGAVEFFSVADSLPNSTINQGQSMICSGESADIEIGFTGTAPWTFTYTIDGLHPTTLSTSENPYTLTVSEEGHYEIIELSDAHYSGTCFTGSADIMVTSEIPTSLVTGDADICEGEAADIPIHLTGTPPWSFTYTLDGADPRTIQTTNNPHILSVSEAGKYELTHLKGGGCLGTNISGSAFINVNPLPTATMKDGNVQIFVDPGESADLPVELTGTPPWSFTYAVDDLNPEHIDDILDGAYVLTDSKIGTYEIKEVRDAICTNQVSLGYPELVLNSLPDLPTSLMTGGDLFICQGEFVPISVQFTGTAPWTFTYAVDTLMTTTIFNTYTNPYLINAIYPGSYEVTALSDSEYSGTEFYGNAYVTLYPLADPGFEYSTDALEVSFTNTTTDADTYLWDFGDGNMSNEVNPVHQYMADGEYTISLTAGNGLCVDGTLARTVIVQAVSVDPIDFEKMLTIYPNPSKGKVTIEIDEVDHSNLTLEIVEANGRVIYLNEFSSGGVVEELDLSSYSSGVYFVRLTSKEFFGVKKLILNK